MKYDSFEIGIRAFNARENKNMKQTELSQALGIHQATYSKFENGRYDMPLSQVIKLCDYLDMPVSWLVGENPLLNDLTNDELLEVMKFIKFVKSKRKQ